MTRYAEKTSVSVAKSKAELEQVLGRYGADKFAYGTDGHQATVGFSFNGKLVRFVLKLPGRGDKQFHETPTGKPRKPAQAEAQWEQACRSAWRSLCLVVKAKLEAVETGITSFESEFMAHIMLPGGKTAGETLLPQIEEAYKTGKMPKLLPYGGKS